jgi:hypothetical protein
MMAQGPRGGRQGPESSVESNGCRPGRNFAAYDSLTIATRELPDESLVSKSRPAAIVIP